MSSKVGTLEEADRLGIPRSEYVISPASPSMPQHPEVLSQLGRLCQIINLYRDRPTIPFEHAQEIRQRLLDTMIWRGISEHDFRVVYRVWTAFMNGLRGKFTAGSHPLMTEAEFDNARQTS